MEWITLSHLEAAARGVKCLAYDEMMSDPVFEAIGKLALKCGGDEKVMAANKKAWDRIARDMDCGVFFRRDYFAHGYRLDLIGLFRHTYLVQTQTGLHKAYAPNQRVLRERLEKGGCKIYALEKVV